MKLNLTLTAIAISCLGIAGLSGCGIQEVRSHQDQVANETRAQLAAVPKGRPVFQMHDGSWLLGEKVRTTKPEPELFEKTASFQDASGHISTLQDIADWIASTYNIRVLVDPSVSSLSLPTGTAFAKSAGGPSVLPLPPASLSAGLSASSSEPQTPLRFAGTFKDFRRVVDQRFGVYSKYSDDTLTFFKTETRTYMLPDLSDSSSMAGTISTDTNGSSSSGATSASSQSASSSTSGAGAAGQSSTLTVQVDPWKTLQETASAIAGSGSHVVADRNIGILTVTGTPPQCDRVEEFMKKLDGQFGKRIAVDVKIFQVQQNQEDNYGLNLNLAYTSGTGHTGATFTGAGVPTVTSSATPMNFGATIVGGSLNGTKAAIQALSTLGNVTEIMSRAGVTRNGKVLALQQATLQDYVQSTQTTLASNVGSSSSIQTATNISGFTSNFIPKLINGDIVMDFDMTLSELQPLTSFTSGSGSNQSTVQLRNMPLARFQQHVGLKPGETLVLTGMQQQTTNTTNNGIGSPHMALLGGGVDAQKHDSMIAVVITARLL